MLKIYLVSWASNNGGEDSSWGVITSKASFAHTGAIVYDKSSYVFVTHLGLCFLIKIKMRHKFLERSMTYVWGEMCKFFYLYQFLSLYDWPQPRVIVSRAKLLSWIHCSILVLLPGHANMQNDDEVKNSHMLIHVQRLSNDIFLGCHRWRIVCSFRNKLYVLYA